MRIIKLGNNLDDVIKETADVLNRGGVVVFPSDTVYGLLADAGDAAAVKKVVEFKERPAGKPISVFVRSVPDLNKFVSVSKQTKKVLNGILPGPFTIVLNSRHVLSQKLESEKGTLGIRIPNYQPINSLMNKYKDPVTATSANLSGNRPVYDIKILIDGLSVKRKKMIDLVIDAGKLPFNRPSTVIDLTKDKINIIRKGEINPKEIKTFSTSSVEETKHLGGELLSSSLKRTNGEPVVFILEGEMGVGKTVFVKGAAECLGIRNIISPSYVVFYEYKVLNRGDYKLFYHFDLFFIKDEEEFRFLNIEKLLKKRRILFFEWGDKMNRNLFSLLTTKSKNIYWMKFKHKGKNCREISFAKI